MNLQMRTLLMVTTLLVIAVLATATVLTFTARQSILAQTKADGVLITELLARSAGFAERVPHDVEDAIGEQMLVEATIAAHLVAIAETANLSPEEINSHLQEIANATVLDEFWITDEFGHAYLRSDAHTDFTFSPNEQHQPQAHIFWPLLTGEQGVVIQEARQREVDDQVFKYVGVGGVDQPRIVQVGYQAAFLHQLTNQVGLPRLVSELVSGSNVSAIRIVDTNYVTLAYSAAPASNVTQALSEADTTLLQTVADQGVTASRLEGSMFKVIAPLIDAEGHVMGATMVYLPTENLQAALRRGVQLSTLVAAFVLAVGILASAILSRRVTQPVAHLTTAAAAVESGTLNPESLDEVSTRGDELGQLARVFQRMIREVKTREEQLKQQVQALRIKIDGAKKARQVAEITETEYFKTLRDQAAELRRRTKGK